MIIGPETRIGKIAMLTAMSDEEEEHVLKQAVAGRSDIKLAVTVVSGMTNKIKAGYTQSILNAALAGGVIKKNAAQIHALIHAGLEALQTMTPHNSVSSSIKMKVAIVSDGKWVIIAAYGDSAFSSFTNHERGGLGIMHL
jgi:hut operon positive regulator